MSTFKPNIPPPPTTFDQWRKATQPFHWWTTNGFDPLPEQTCACGCGRRWDAHIGGNVHGDGAVGVGGILRPAPSPPPGETQ